MNPRTVRTAPWTAGLGLRAAALTGVILVAMAMPAARAQDPYEPNDSWTQATPLQNGVPIEARIAPDGDRDWFTFQVTRSGQLDIRLGSLPADYDLYIARYNPQTQQMDGVPYQNHFGTTPEIYTGYVQVTGTYYIRVYAEAGVYDELDSYSLKATWPAALPAAENVLEVGSARGAPGTHATVALRLRNDNVVKALQVDLHFDPALVAFEDGQAAGRASEMVFAAALQADGVVRVVLYNDGAEHLPAGDGAVANLTFTLAGAAGSQCAITPDGVLLADLDAQALTVVAAAGALAVIDGAQAPSLRVFTLKNPARPRTLQVFAASDQALASPPVVTVGSASIAMAGVDGAENLYLGIFHAEDEADSVSIGATGSNGVSTGGAQTTVVF